MNIAFPPEVISPRPTPAFPANANRPPEESVNWLLPVNPANRPPDSNVAVPAVFTTNVCADPERKWVVAAAGAVASVLTISPSSNGLNPRAKSYVANRAPAPPTDASAKISPRTFINGVPTTEPRFNPAMNKLETPVPGTDPNPLPRTTTLCPPA
jgi:hypothetical protein